MAHKSLAPGIRFHPTDVELIKYYLQKKVTGKHICFDVISEVDVYKFSPSDLPDKSLLKSTDLEWYFFCPRERKYANGARMNRATEYGYWKTTGRDRPIKYNHRTVGMIKTLIYHEGRAPHGNRTDWVMHEYRLEDEDLSKSGVAQDAYVICKIFLKSGPGPRSTQHLFKEEDWIDGDDDGTSLDECPLNGLSFPSALNLINPDSSTVTNPCNAGSISIDASIEAGPSASVTFLKAADSDKYNILLSELPNSPKEFPSLMNTQKDVSLSELPQASNSHVYEMQTSTNYKQCQVGMHGNPCSFPELSNDAMFSTWEMHGGDNHMLPSRSHREEVEHLPDINRGGMVQSSTLAHPDVYNELGNLFDLEVDALNDDSFIELDDLSNPLGDEPHWSHLIPSDDLLSGLDPHLNRVSSFHPVDEYGGSFCDNAPAESLLLPGSSLGSIGHTDIQQKDYAVDNRNNMFFCAEKGGISRTETTARTG